MGLFSFLKEKDDLTEEDIMSLVNEGDEQGVLESDEAEMIGNIVELDEKEAGDIMVHRRNLSAIDGEKTLKEAVDFILYEGINSRYPVFMGDLDHIIGILTLKDAIIAARDPECEQKKLCEIKGLLRKVNFIPETRKLDDLLGEMQKGKLQLVVVIDEFGQTAGIVTMEDILEEIVGNIMDEYDVDENNIAAQPDGSFIVNGLTTLDELEDKTGIRFNEEEHDSFDTLNGFLIAEIDRIPVKGEHYTIKSRGFQFDSIKVEDRIIRSVRMSVLQDKAE